MKKIGLIIIGVLVIVCGILYNSNIRLTKQYNTSIENIKAYDMELSNVTNQSRVYKLTIEQLNTFKDSTLLKINEMREEMGIKDKRLKQLQYELSFINKSDTLITPDTIFKNPSFELDTIMGDKWFQNHLYLKYPNIVVSTPTIELERLTAIQGRRETVKPPKKFFLFRWFQKKHTVVEVQIRERNPYVKNKTQRFIEIVE